MLSQWYLYCMLLQCTLLYNHGRSQTTEGVIHMETDEFANETEL